MATDPEHPDGPADQGTASPEEASAPAALLLERLTGIEAGIAEFHRRSRHREQIIERLHAENQELRAGLRDVVLEPVVVDLIRLHDGLMREAELVEAQLADTGDVAKLLASFASDVELTLERCGIEAFKAAPGDAYRTGEHQAVGVVPSDDPACHHTIARILGAGFRDRESGRVRRPVQATVYRHQPPEQSTGPDAP